MGSSSGKSFLWSIKGEPLGGGSRTGEDEALGASIRGASLDVGESLPLGEAEESSPLAAMRGVGNASCLS